MDSVFFYLHLFQLAFSKKQKKINIFKRIYDKARVGLGAENCSKPFFAMTPQRIRIHFIMQIQAVFSSANVAWKFWVKWDRDNSLELKKMLICPLECISSGTFEIESEKQRLVCVPEFYGRTGEKLEVFKSPSVRIQLLKNVYIIGQTNVVADENCKHLLSDSFCFTDGDADLSFGNLISTKRGYAYVAMPRTFDFINNGINLVHPGSYNYYHFAIELLSKLIICDRKSEYRDWPVIVDKCVQRQKNMMYLLEKIRGNHDIIWVEQDKRYKVNALVCSDSVSWMPTNVLEGHLLKKKYYMMIENVLTELKLAYEQGIDFDRASDKSGRYIFLSRKNTEISRLINEKKIEEAFVEAGFSVVFPELLSIEEQAKMFHSAKCIVGATGGAFTNIIFCKPGTVIGCIIPAEFRFYLYSTMAYNLGLKCVYLDAEIIERDKRYIATSRYDADDGKLADYIEQLKKLTDIQANYI